MIACTSATDGLLSRVTAHALTIAVGLLAAVVTEPPPDKLTALDAAAGPLNGTFKVTTIDELAPGFSTALVVQEAVATLQVHVEPPFSPTSVSPAGTVSVTVIGPEVGPALAPFATVTLYTAF
jgi:hypothetical protein